MVISTGWYNNGPANNLENRHWYLNSIDNPNHLQNLNHTNYLYPLSSVGV